MRQVQGHRIRWPVGPAHPGKRIEHFWLLTAVSALVLGYVAVLWVRSTAVPSQVTIAQGMASGQAVVERVLPFVNEWRQSEDPLVTLPEGVQAKASNVNGIEIAGVRYYYQLTHQMSFDPLRRGLLTREQVTIVGVVDPDTANEVTVYRLR